MDLYSNNSDNSPQYCKFFCGKRTCKFPGCREKWALKEWACLMISHVWEPLPYKLRLSPSKYKTTEEKLAWLDRVLDLIRNYNRRCPSDRIELALYPDVSAKGVLHFNGVVRASNEAYKWLKSVLKQNRFIGEDDFSFKAMEYPKNQIAYQIGRTYMHELGDLSFKKCRFPVIIGKPFLMSKSDLWFIAKVLFEVGLFQSYVSDVKMGNLVADSIIYKSIMGGDESVLEDFDPSSGLNELKNPLPSEVDSGRHKRDGEDYTK